MLSVLCCLYMCFLLQACVYVHVHVCTHISVTRLLNCQVFKFYFVDKDEVCLFYKAFVLWQLLAKTRWKLFKQEVWAQSFPAGCKTLRGRNPENIPHCPENLRQEEKPFLITFCSFYEAGLGCFSCEFGLNGINHHTEVLFFTIFLCSPSTEVQHIFLVLPHL